MKKHRYIVANYTLYAIENGKKTFVEKTAEQRPFAFISGMDMVLDDLEETMVTLSAGETFDLTITPDRAFGQRNENRCHTLDKSHFYRDGAFDSENIYEGAVVKMNDGNRNIFDAKVVSVGETTVTLEIDVDLNHPLAGKTLRFVGNVSINREATDEEVERMNQMLHGGHCGGCGGCGGDCDSGCGDGCGGGCCGNCGN